MFKNGLAKPNSVYATPDKFDPSVAKPVVPGGPDIFKVPGPI